MPKPLSVTFLGTCAGGGPIQGRACSSTSLNHVSASWLIDCAEGTQDQIRKTSNVHISKIRKVFFTHLHVDHCMGIIPLMTSALRFEDVRQREPRLELYGPAGLRKLIRLNLQITQPNLIGKYAAHELLVSGEQPTTCVQEELFKNELPGRDILCDVSGVWRDFETSEGMSVDAGPILHRIACIGYVFREPPILKASPEFLSILDNTPRAFLPTGVQQPRQLLRDLLANRPIQLKNGDILQPPSVAEIGRKIVILGDTCDASGMAGLAQDASLLVHESTNAYIPPHIDPKSSKQTPESVQEKALAYGHSTPAMAGDFARRINAQRLFLNHLSAKFQPPLPYQSRARNEERTAILQEIERQASEAWGGGRAVCASDLLTVHIPHHATEQTPVS
ncbi:hypothetical protein SISNIDRAFT_545856 [Sistotremastrum niveocremeum HHB9708]|uniref:Metallo-beta-lactamase domain-containing protein n=1 Tax=Sistotremastrum niveocremeum HHB9708 TaxID=1314777 RepID=A0A165AHU7_9AGAM|nr:hypothetical protein SISNIDRAFT_545856 [Sistotremastrum niveocremeum HHB9708]